MAAYGSPSRAPKIPHGRYIQVRLEFLKSPEISFFLTLGLGTNYFLHPPLIGPDKATKVFSVGSFQVLKSCALQLTCT